MAITQKSPGLPGERWLVNLQPIDESTPQGRQGVVKLVDFDPKTNVWSVEPEVEGAPKEIDAKHLIEPAPD